MTPETATSAQHDIHVHTSTTPAVKRPRSEEPDNRDPSLMQVDAADVGASAILPVAKRARLSRHSAAEVSQAATAAGFNPRICFCTLCQALKPSDDFFPSYLRRNVNYCKSCCLAKAKAYKNRPKKRANSRTTPVNRTPQRQAELALKALHRLCAHPWLPAVTEPHNQAPMAAAVITNDTGVATQPAPAAAAHAATAHRGVHGLTLSVGFGTGAARKILEFWRGASALSSLDARLEDSATLQLIPWFKLDASPLQPWEIVPMTRMQARRLADVPYRMWAACLQDDLCVRIEERLQQFKARCTAEPDTDAADVPEAADNATHDQPASDAPGLMQDLSFAHAQSLS